MQSYWDLYNFFLQDGAETQRVIKKACAHTHTHTQKDSCEEKARKCPHINKQKRLEGTRTTLALDLGLLFSRAVRNRFQ